MSRFSASLFHLLISAAVATVLFLLAWFVIYPAPMFVAIGGHEVFLLLIGIDVILGPLLTLVVFKSGKRTLKFDLVVIAAMQIAALVYGVSQIYEARPVFVAALGSKFQVIQATELAYQNIQKSGKPLPMFGPVWVGTTAPTNRFDREEVKDVTDRAGGGVGHFPQFHTPIESAYPAIRAAARPIGQLFAIAGNDPKEIGQWLGRRGYTTESAQYQPIEIAISRFALMIDGATGKPIGISPFMCGE